jgi:hypothetical protein
MAIYKTACGWTIEEDGFMKEGFASRDAARTFNSERKAGNIPSNTTKVNEKPATTTPVTESTEKTAIPRPSVDPDACPVRITKTGNKIYSKIYKTTVIGNDKSGWRILFDNVHVATTNTKDDAWTAARWMKVCPATRINS